MYFTAETVTTVNYGDFSYMNQSPWLMGGAVVLMLLGAMFLAVFFAMLTNMWSSRRIEESLGRTRRITGLRGHALVIGLGSVGMQAASRLVAAGSEVVVVEKHEANRHLSQARALGVPVVIAGRHPARDPGVGQPGQCLGRGRTHQRRPGQPGKRPPPCRDQLRDALGGHPGGAAHVRPAAGPLGPAQLRVPQCPLHRRTRRCPGSSARRSASTCSARSTWVTSRCWWPRLTVSRGGGLDGLAMGDLGAQTRILAISRVPPQAYLEHPPRRGTRPVGAAYQAYLIGPYEELLAVLRRDRPTHPRRRRQPPPRPPRPPGRRPLPQGAANRRRRFR